MCYYRVSCLFDCTGISYLANSGFKLKEFFTPFLTTEVVVLWRCKQVTSSRFIVLMSILTLVEVESQRFQNGRDFSEKRVRGSGSLASESFHSTMNGYHMNGMESAYVGRAEEDVGIGSPQSPAGNPLPCPCRNPSVSFEY